MHTHAHTCTQPLPGKKRKKENDSRSGHNKTSLKVLGNEKKHTYSRKYSEHHGTGHRETIVGEVVCRRDGGIRGISVLWLNFAVNLKLLLKIEQLK